MRVGMLTREYPPDFYGGAGVHVAELVAVLREKIDVTVGCFGQPRDEHDVVAHDFDPALLAANPALATFDVDLRLCADMNGVDLVHSHTWYANLGGHLASLLHGVPHVVTAHSLEPMRPWKAEQLGGGYVLSSWAERTAFVAASAVIAVSDGMKADILRSYPDIDPECVHVIHNGIDLAQWRRNDDRDAVRALGIDPDLRTVVFVGRITRQKGLPYLLRAAKELPSDVQIVLCAGAPDTPEIAAEVASLVEELSVSRDEIGRAHV